MDNSTMAIWYDKIYRPYASEHNAKSALLLDDFLCHKGDALQEVINSDNAIRIMIPPHYTCIVQPCDVGINKPLKDKLKQFAAKWRRERHSSLPAGSKMPVPKRHEVVTWLKKIWDEFPEEIVRNSFRGSGYVFEEGVDYNGETESESEGDE